MNKKIFIYIILFISLFIYNSIYLNAQSSIQLNTDTIELVYDSVYEVLVKKPFDNPYTKEEKIKNNRESEIREDPIIYEEELPWDTLNYPLRVDEYYSIGTAFAISENTFISAAHVVGLDAQVLWGDLFIRDRNGNVTEVDQVIKYSNYRDYILFTTKTKFSSRFLKINSDIKLNTKVFAVGNALGDGIVIRDGLLTSLTKETETGSWDWIRFSAAASPGNSGGPLLNENGEVIGIVLRKSQDENLNYALPISELLNAKENTAIYHKFDNYNLLITTKRYGPEKFDKEIILPLHYKKLREENVKINKGMSEYLKDKLLEKYSNVIFPNGVNSFNLLHFNKSIYFPHLILENENDGIWDVYRPTDIKEAQLNKNGYMNYGGLKNLGLYEFRKPDNMSIKEVYEDSKLFIETFLKGYPLNRNFGTKQIRIISLGEPFEKYVYIDRYKRKWIVETWLLEFANSKMVIFSLPTPSGRIGMFYIGDIQNIDNDLLIDIKEYTNYIYYSYNGTFVQWKDFFKQIEYIPDIFKSYNFSYNENKVSFNCENFEVSYNNEFFKIEDDSYLVTKNSYYKNDNNNIIWDLTGISIGENKNDKNYLSLVRSAKPEEELPDKFHDDWDDLIQRKYPFNRESQLNGSITYISDLHNKFSTLNNYDKGLLKKVYFLGISLEGKIEDKIIKEKLDLLNSSVKIHEDYIPAKEGVLRH